MGLREPVETYPLCRVASHALFGPWMTQRIATECRTGGLYLDRWEVSSVQFQAKSKAPGYSRRQSALRPRRIRMAHTPSRITAARHIHLADHGHKPTESNHPALADGGHSDREQVIRSRSEISLRPGASRIGMMTTTEPPDIYPDRSQSPDRTLMWMQPAPAHHLGPMRMGLREPVETYPLCRVASHALLN